MRISGRLEYYADPHGIIMPTAFYDVAQSLSGDYKLNKMMMLRSEVKHSAKFGHELLLGLILNGAISAKKGNL
jgi:hypothetical protein